MGALPNPQEPTPEPIGIRELRQHASRYVAMAKAGQRVPVTEHGKLVAYLIPAKSTGSSVLDQMIATGQVKLPVGSIRDVLPVPPAPGDGPPLSDVLQQMRDEERY